MAEEQISTGFLGLSTDPDKMLLEDLGEEKIDQISQDIKAKTMGEISLGTDVAEIKRQRDSVSSRLLQSGKISTGVGTPLTTVDAEKLGSNFYSPNIGKEHDSYISTSKFVPRPDVAGTGFFAKALRNTPIVKDIVPDKYTGKLPDVLYSLYEADDKTVLRNALSTDGTRTDTATEAAIMLGEEGKVTSQEVDVLSGVVRVDIPLAYFNPEFATEAGFADPSMPTEAILGTVPFYIKFEKKTQEEINDSIQRLLRGYREREGNGLYNPRFKSLPDIPLEFNDYGYNVRAKKNLFNDIIGYKVDPKQTDLGRDLQRSLGTVYDAFSQVLIPVGMWSLDYAGRIVLGGGGEILSIGTEYFDQWDMNTGKAKKGKLLEKWIKNMTTIRDKYSATIPSSSEILANYMFVPDAESAINGYLTWSEEDIGRYVQGKDAPALRKFFADYAAGLMFAKVIDKVMLPIVGLGPKAAERFMLMINGDLTLTKKMKKITGWETAFDIWAKTQTVTDKKGKQIIGPARDDILRGRWGKLRQGDKAHYTNKAFSSYLLAHNKQNATILYPTSWGNKLRMNRLDVGSSIPAHWQRVKMGERLASGNGVFFSEAFGEEWYIPSAIGGTIGFNFLFNTKWYKRALTNRIGSFAAAPLEFGKGGAFSGMDSIYYAISGKGRPLQTAQYNAAMAAAVRQGIPEGDRNLWVYTNYGLISDDPAARKLPPFYVVDGDGTERLVKEGDREYDELQDLADQINNVTDPAIKARQIDSIKKFLDLQNGFAKQIKKAGDAFLERTPGGDITQYILNHPLNKLGGALFEVLDLFTTRVFAESLASKANFGRLKGISLADAEIMYQARREKLDSIGRYMDEISTYMNKGEVDESINVLANKLQNAFDEEADFMIDMKELLQANGSVITKRYNLDILEFTENEIKQFAAEDMNQYWDELHIEALKKGPEAARQVIRRKQLEMWRLMRSMIHNMQTNHVAMSKDGQGKIFSEVINMVDNRIRNENNQLYAPLVKALEEGGIISLKGEDVDRIFLDFVKVLRNDPEEVLSGKNLTNLHSVTTRSIFKSALRPNGDRVREGLKATFPDMTNKQISEQLGFDINDDLSIYGLLLEPTKFSDKAQASIMLIKKTFGQLEINDTTLVKMHKALKFQQYKLTKKASGRIIGQEATQDELGRLDVYNRILGTKDKVNEVTGETIVGIKGALTNVIEKTGNVKVFKLYLQTDNAYATFGAPRRWNMFDQKVMGKVERLNKSLPDVDGNVTYTKVYTKTKAQQLETLGQMFLDNPEETMEMVLEKFGTKARVPTGEYKTIVRNGKRVSVPIYEDTYVIGSDIAGDNLRFTIRAAISATQKSNLEKDLTNYKVKFKDRNFRKSLIEIDPALAKKITEWAFGGSSWNSINKVSQLTTIKQGTQTWTGEIDDAGDFIFASDNAFTLKQGDDRLGEEFGKFDLRRKIAPASTLEDQWGKRTFNWEDDSNRMFSLEFNNAIQANTKLKRDVKIFHLSVKNANLKVSKNANRYKEKADLKHNALQIYLQRMGLSKVPSGVKEGAQIDIKKMSELLFSDGTGKQAAKFEEFILKAKSSTLNKSGKHLSFLTGPNSVKEAEVKEYVDMLLKHHYINSILDEAGTRTVKSLDGKVAITPNFVPNYSKVKLAERNMRGLLVSRLGEEYAEQFLMVAELMTYGAQESGLKALGKHQSWTLLNTPSQLSVASGLARIFAMLREVVSPRWVGADAAIRDMRFRKAEVIRTLLTSDHTLKANGVSVIEALFEVLHNGNYNERYGIALGRLLPTVMAEADLEIMSNETAKERDVKLVGIPLSEFTTGESMALGYVPSYPKGVRDPYKDLISDEQSQKSISGIEQFRDRILKEYVSWTNFNHAVSSGEIKANQLHKRWEVMKRKDKQSGEGNPIINQMNMLIQ